jgi:hypothetical protein
MIRLLGLCGSLRAASSSAALLRALADRLDGRAAVELGEIGELPHYNADVDGGPAVAALIKAIAEADGLLFVTPEYNYSVPGVLKNAIDWASRPAMQSVFKGKPAFRHLGLRRGARRRARARPPEIHPQRHAGGGVHDSRKSSCPAPTPRSRTAPSPTNRRWSSHLRASMHSSTGSSATRPAIVSTPFISPTHPSLLDGQCARATPKGVNIGRRSPASGGHNCTPIHRP